MNMFLWCFKPKFYKKRLAFFVLLSNDFLILFVIRVINEFVVVEMKCSKSTTSYMKIRLDRVRKKRVAMVNYLKMDIVDFLKNGLDYNAYTRVIKNFLIVSLCIREVYFVFNLLNSCYSRQKYYSKSLELYRVMISSSDSAIVSLKISH